MLRRLVREAARGRVDAELVTHTVNPAGGGPTSRTFHPVGGGHKVAPLPSQLLHELETPNLADG